MEEKKNNAVEKVENIVNDLNSESNSSKDTANTTNKQKTQYHTQTDFSGEKNFNKSHNTQPKYDQRKKQRAKRIEQKRLAKQKKLEEKQSAIVEKERISAEKRLELARIKARKRAEQEKARATALRDKNRRKAQILARREQLREQKEKHKQENRRSRKGMGGWITAVVVLGLATLALSSALTFTFLMPQKADISLEASYGRSFYDAIEQVDNMDLNLSKILASADNQARQQYLVDLAINSELCENDLQELPLKDENKFYTTKIVNQIGDYAKYLNKKLINFEELTYEDMQNLTALYKANLTIKQAFEDMANSMGNDFTFASLDGGGKGNAIINRFNELQNLSVEYPELIYDGPFSDGQTNKQFKAIKGSEIDKLGAEEVFKKVFADRNLEKVTVLGSNSITLQTFNLVGKTDNGDIYAEVSKIGGKLIMFDIAGSCKEVNYQQDYAIDCAKEFLQKLEISGMKAVWTNLANNVYTINFAYSQNDIIIYPDMIKVRVCAETGKVIGMEATSYYANHTQRSLVAPSYSKGQASQKLANNILIESVRLVVCPIGLNQEKLCYEFYGEINGESYYIYLDANTLKQVEMFKVVEGSEGLLLM